VFRVFWPHECSLGEHKILTVFRKHYNKTSNWPPIRWMAVGIKVIIKDLDLTCVPVWAPGADGDSLYAAFILHFNNIPFLILTLVAGAVWFLVISYQLQSHRSLIKDRSKPSGVYLELSPLGCFQLWGGIQIVSLCLLIVHQKY